MFSGTLGGTVNGSVSTSAMPGTTNGNNFGLIKTGAGTFTLTGANTYAGDTTVNGGTLSLGSINASNDSSTITIAASGALMKLSFVGTDTVARLFIGTSQKPPGTYGHGSTGATNGGLGVGALDAYFATGTGTLTVTSGPAGFDSWIIGTFVGGTVPLGMQGPNDDPDHDGIPNLVEYAIAGQDPTVVNAAIGNSTSNSLSFTKRSDAIGLTYVIEQSSDLGGSVPWTEVTGGSYVNNATTIAYTLTPGSPSVNFIRLRVSTELSQH
jgi:autotransporter-associated beta strand protein